MSTRPAHAKDCPGCDTGWTVGELLCPLCTTTVHTSQPELYDRWLSARARYNEMVNNDDGGPSHYDLMNAEACIEAYYRGFIVGTARVLSAQRAAQHEEWKRRKQQRQQRRTRP